MQFLVLEAWPTLDMLCLGAQIHTLLITVGCSFFFLFLLLGNASQTHRLTHTYSNSLSLSLSKDGVTNTLIKHYLNCILLNTLFFPLSTCFNNPNHLYIRSQIWCLFFLLLLLCFIYLDSRVENVCLSLLLASFCLLRFLCSGIMTCKEVLHMARERVVEPK